MKIGDIVDGKYELVRQIGKGGMGSVWEVRHTRTKQRLALKLLLSEMENEANVIDRFVQEAQAAAAIGSDHIIFVTDAGDTADGTPYMVMEYLEGEDLSQIMKREGPMDPQRAVNLIIQACEGLGAAHEAGIIHRDVKPANLFVTRKTDGAEWVKVLDFGIARVQDATKSMTSTKAVLGTFLYMSPEQAESSKGVDARADVYSLGVTLYEMLSGTAPYDADSFKELFVKIMMGQQIPLGEVRPGLSEGLVAAVTKAMASDIEERYSSMRTFGGVLQRFQEQSVDRGTSPDASLSPPPTQVVQKKTGSAWPQPPPEKPILAPTVAVRSDHEAPKRNLVIAIGTLALFVVVLGAFLAFREGAAPREGSSGVPGDLPPRELEAVSAAPAVGPGHENLPAVRNEPEAVVVSNAAVDQQEEAPGDPEEETVVPLQVSSTPPGAKISVDGVDQPGTAPLDLSGFPAGNVLNIGATLAGYKRASETIYVSDETQAINFRLLPLDRRVVLTAPVKARFFVRGRLVAYAKSHTFENEQLPLVVEVKALRYSPLEVVIDESVEWVENQREGVLVYEPDVLAMSRLETTDGASRRPRPSPRVRRRPDPRPPRPRPHPAPAPAVEDNPYR